IMRVRPWQRTSHPVAIEVSPPPRSSASGAVWRRRHERLHCATEADERSCRTHVDTLMRDEVGEVGADGAEPNALGAAEAEDPRAFEAVAELREDATLKGRREVHEHVAAEDDVEVAEG